MPENRIPPFGVVYRATNTVNGKIYVGKTRGTLRARVSAHLSHARNGHGFLLHAAIRKYGDAAFTFETIEPAMDATDLNTKEIRWIEVLGCRVPTGYNLSRGGDGGRERLPHDLSLIGRAFGRLTVVEPDGYKGNRPWWKCRCICGTVKSYRESSVTSGNAKSCGCGRVDAARKRGIANREHGSRSSLAYRRWQYMKHRCKTTGTVLCERWERFETFLADMGECPPNMSLVRINTSEAFGPVNCKWRECDHTVRRPSHRTTFLTLNGVTKPQRQWARELHIPYDCLYSRILYGWSDERALTEPVGAIFKTEEWKEQSRRIHTGHKTSDATRKKISEARLKGIASRDKHNF